MASYSSELSKELPHQNNFRLAARMATSRHVTRTHSMKAINTCLLFCSILGGLVGLAYLIFDPIVKHVILSKLVLRNNSDFAELWSEPPIQPHLKVYFFNLTNAPQFFAGEEKPKLQEVGPYVYLQKWHKENIAWHSNGTMSYSTRKEYTFMPGMSVGDHRKDLITTINVPTASAYYQMREANFFTAFGLDTVLSSLEYKMWVTHTAEELIWGYDEPLFEVAKFTLPNPPALEKFGFFVGANATENLSTYTMYTGEGNPYNLSKIHRFNGEQRLKYWKTDQCNQVIGSDAATFNPYIQKEETLWFFNDQLCRSMPLVFEKKVVSRTLPGYRFVPRPDVFMSPKSHPENDCYCVDKTLCSMLGDGMFGISKCQFDAPIVLSWPHFLNAEEKFINSVEGLRPNKDRHGFWFDIQGTTGTTLSAKARLQINIALKRSDTFDAMSKINDTILPAIWFEEGLDELGDDLIDVIGEAVHGPPQYKNYLLSTLLGLGLSTFVIGVVAAVRHCLDRRLGPNRRDDALREVAKRLTDMQQINNHGGQHQHSGPRRLSAFVEEVCQPMLGSSGFASGATTDECSRATTATHSRNASDGSSIPVEPGAADDAERLRLILDSKAGTDAPV